MPANPRLGENTDSSTLKILLISVAVMVIGIVLVVVYMAAFRHKGSRPDYRDPRFVTISSEAADQAALDGMRKGGADLSKPAAITHSLFLPTLGFAQTAAGDLGNDYKVRISPTTARPDQRFLLLATRTVVPTLDYLRDSRARFNDLAIKYGGDYAGWKAAIVR